MKRKQQPKVLRLTGEVWREGTMYIAYCRELDLASCGYTVEEAAFVSQGEKMERQEHFIGQIDFS